MKTRAEKDGIIESIEKLEMLENLENLDVRAKKTPAPNKKIATGTWNQKIICNFVTPT